jgi:hypothetical protein
VKNSVVHPIMKPAQRPQATHAKALNGVQVIVSPAETISKVSGKKPVSGNIAPVIKIVDKNSYHLIVLSTVLYLTLVNDVAKN